VRPVSAQAVDPVLFQNVTRPLYADLSFVEAQQSAESFVPAVSRRDYGGSLPPPAAGASAARALMGQTHPSPLPALHRLATED
jgi:hypothetical protein